MVFACGFFLLTAGTQAEEIARTQLSLVDLLKKAEQNPTLKHGIEAARLTAQAKSNKVQMERWLTNFELTTYSGLVPNVNADAAVAARDPQALLFDTRSGQIDDDFGFQHLGPFVRVEVKAVQPLWTWGKISSYEAMADRGKELAEWERVRLTNQLRFLVKRAYYGLMYSEDAIKLLEDVRGKLRKAEEQVEELLIKNAENVDENDRLKIRVFLSDVETRALDAAKGRQVARSALFELAGVSGDWKSDQLDLEPELVQGIQKDQVISEALRASPEIRQLDKMIELKMHERGAVKADLFPTFFVAGQLGYAVAPNRTDIKSSYLNDDFNRFDLGVALGLKQDLGIHRTLNRVSEVDAEVAILRAKREQLAAKTRLDVEEAFEKAVSNQQALESNENGFRAARSLLTSAGLAFSLGTVPTKDVLESYAAYFKAKIDLLKNTYDLNNSLADLSQATGTELVPRLR